MAYHASMAAEPPPDKGTWKTVAMLVTLAVLAVGGVVLLIVHKGASRPGAAATAEPTRKVAIPSANPVPLTPGPGGWAGAIAIFQTDSAEYRSRADLVRFCVDGGIGVFVYGARNVPFESMASLQVLRSDDATTAGGRAQVKITETTGAVITGAIDSTCDFVLQTQAGQENFFPAQIKRIDFLRSPS